MIRSGRQRGEQLQGVRGKRRAHDLRPAALFDAMLAAEYGPGLQVDRWLHGILRATDSFLDHGHGAIGWIFRRDHQFMPATPAAINDGERFIEVAIRVSAALGAVSLATLLSPTPCLVTSSEAHGLGNDLVRHPVFREHAHPVGIKDFLALKVSSPCGRIGCVIGAPLNAISDTSSYDKRPWRLLAKHMSLGLSVQSQADSGPFEPSRNAAIFTPDGNLQHVAPAARRTDCLETLRRAVLARERARLVRTDPTDAIEYLDSSLMRFALIDHFDSDGKRFVVACAPHGVTNTLDLPPRLHQIASLLVTSGHSRKQLADQLGVSIHTFDTEVKALYRRLNVRSRSELAVRVRDYPILGTR